MNAIILVNGLDLTEFCLLSATRIAYDSTKRITTASITVMGEALNTAASAYDSAIYDHGTYSFAIREMYEVVILDGRDGVTKLFAGQIYAIALQQTDAPHFPVVYQCDLNDAAAYLDRSVCWDSSFPLTMPNSDKGIIEALLGRFCPKIAVSDIAELVPVIQKFDWATKSCRQILDDLSTLSMGSWHVDFEGVLHYYRASGADPAPFGLSTSPDYVTTFPVRVDNYKHDFTNPVNHAYVRGLQDPATGLSIEANYADPVSIQQYGEYATGVVDEQIITGWDAALKAKSMVLGYAYPIETGSFTIWGPDGLKCGQKIHIREDNLGFEGDYTIISLTMQWTVDKDVVEYQGQFGGAKPDLETILRLLDQRTKWQTSNPPTAGGVAPGSITDASIAAPGLSASSIQSVSANTIIGQIQSSQIQTVNAGSIVGVISADHIGGVQAQLIQGAIVANQIGSVQAAVIQGVIVSGQVADGIIDNLAKYADALRPVPIVKVGDPWPPALPNDNFPPRSFFYRQTDGHFYQVTDDGGGYFVNDSPQNSVMSFYNIGAMNAQSIVGLIVAAQIQSITAGQITGAIQANQIGAVNASVIAGYIQAGQIATVNASAIQGKVSATNIDTIQANQITGYIQGTQIQAINATTITIGLIADGQIGSISGAKLIVGTVASDKLDTYAVNVGGGTANKPGRINVYDGSNALIGQVGTLDASANYGGWFKVFGAGGTGYADAKVKTDAGGNLSITNATFGITGGSATLTTSPATFDVTYSSGVSLQIADATDKACLVSRGLVLYYNGSKVGSFVRSPSGGYASLEIAAGAYVLIDGSVGVRSDSGYAVGGTRVINSSGQFTGTVTGTVTGTINSTAQITTTASVSAAGGYTGGAFTGQGVNCPSYGIGGAGFNPAGYTGQTYNVAFRDNAGNALQLWINGANVGQLQLRVVGGVVVGYG